MVDEVARQWPQRPRFLQSFFLATHVPKTAAPSPASRRDSKRGRSQGLAEPAFFDKAFPESLRSICLNLIGQNCVTWPP